MEWWTLVVVFVLGAFAASFANAAIYGWAWNARRVSPWQPTPEGAPPRGWADRVPVVGWLRLRRDTAVLGRGFWVRPMAVEILFGVAMAALYAWEAPGAQLVAPQVGAVWPAVGYSGVAAFVAHFVLAWLMLVASLIDVDEKTIPDEVTVTGVLLGLIFAAAMPNSLLPNVQQRAAPPAIGSQLSSPAGAPLVGAADLPLYAEPTHIASPADWPTGLGGGENRDALLLGLGCYALWCFALTNRVWRGRRGFFVALWILLRRVAHDLRSRPLREILLGGVLVIACVWFSGGAAWVGLMSSLVGMAVGGGIVWAVRVIGSTALRKEAMGFGDVTLMMMIGAFLGWQASLVVFFLAPFAGLVIGGAQLALRRGDVIPYGPFLCLAACGVVVGWGRLWPRAERYFEHGPVLPIVIIVCLVLLGLLLWIWRLAKERLLGVTEA